MKMKDVYVVSAFGYMIDTICEVFKSKEDAYRFIQKQWDDLKDICGDIEIETIVEERIWKTNDSLRQLVEWEIHKRDFSEIP